MRRRPLIIAASAIVIIGVLAGIYFAFFSGSAELTVSDNPFGNVGSGDAVLPEADSGAGTEIAPRLIRISDRPVAEGVSVRILNATSIQTFNTASDTPAVVETSVPDVEVRFIDRASGNIYKFLERARSLTRLSNKTLPGVQRASWLPDGSTAYVQFLTQSGADEHVASYVLPETGEGGFFLEQDLAQATAVGSSSLFTLLSGTTGAVGSVSKADGTGARTLFTSLLSALSVHPSSGAYYANTKPSLFLGGYAFSINSTNGAFSRLLGPLRGLSTLPSPDGKYLLYSYVDQGSLRLGALDTSSRAATALPVATMADKCAWTADSQHVYCGVPTGTAQGLPDSWYQGAVSFSDRLWEIDMAQRLASLVIDPAIVADISVDMTALRVAPDNSFVIFMDRETGTLWSYEL